MLQPSGGDILRAGGVAAYGALSVPNRKVLAVLNAERDFLKSLPAHRFARMLEPTGLL